MSEITTTYNGDSNEAHSRLLKCENCGIMRPAQESSNGLIPHTSSAGDKCDECGGKGFVQVLL